MDIVECKNVTKTIAGKNILNELNLMINEDKITGLIGRNGAGKTTLMKILAGYWKETSGEVRVFSQRPFNNLFVSANAIYIDDLMTFSNNLTLIDILVEAERAFPNWDSKLAKRLFEYFEFHPKMKHSALSKGKKSTFNVIIGLAARCKLTMLDEPITGMDKSTRKDFYRALLKDYLAHPRSIIVSSHHLAEIEELLEDIILIDRGKVILHESVDDLKVYAQGVSGRTEILRPLLKKEDVIYQTEIASNITYAVLRTESKVLEKLRQLGLDVGPVSVEDLCMCLTSEQKGGIDSVFK